MKKEAEKIVVPTEKLCDALKQHIRAEDSSALTDQMPESKSSIDKFLMIVAADVLKMSAGAAHFAKVSPQVTDIAKVVEASPEEILNWAKTPFWKEVVRSYGWSGDPTPQDELRSETDPIPLRESFLIHKVFQKEKGSRVRFETYDSAIKGRVNFIDRYHFVLKDSSDSVVHQEKDDRMRLDKLKVVLVFPENNMPFVKKGVARRKGVADMELRPIEKASERPNIKTLAALGSMVKCVMRNGLVVKGEYVWNSRYYMVMRVGGRKGAGGKIIIVYKHALLQFQVIKHGEKRRKRYSDDWDTERQPRPQEIVNQVVNQVGNR